MDTFRHTALTDLAVLGCDVFTLSEIAGHSSVTVTEKYCHPQADAIEKAFALAAGKKLVAGLVTPQNKDFKIEEGEGVNIV